MTLNPGQVLNNRYRIVRLLGQGGFGAVYKAWDLKFNAACAVKENFDTSVEAVRQFGREATILSQLNHPNLPRVTDHFSNPGQGQYLVMDYVEGRDLSEILAAANAPLPEAQVLAWAEQVCSALEYLHTRQPAVIHRDIKPSNIRITPNGTVMLVDFGIAKIYDPSLRTTLGARAVSPGFSPPEQYGNQPTDARTDIYALGATLYTLLANLEPPESIARVTGTKLTPLRSLNPAVSPTAELAIQAAMQPLPDDRFANVSELRAALTGKGTLPHVRPQPSLVNTVTVTTSPATLVTDVGLPTAGIPQPARKSTAWKWLALSGGLLTCLVLLGLGYFLLQGIQSGGTASEAESGRAGRPSATGESAPAEARGADTTEEYVEAGLPTKSPTATLLPPSPDTTLTAIYAIFVTPSFTPPPPTATVALPFYNVRACSAAYFDGDQCTIHESTLTGPLTRVYGSWNFRDLSSGMEIRREWFLDNVYYWTTTNTVGESDRWATDQPTFWIYIDNQEGSAARAFNYPAMLPAGSYRMDMYLEGRYITALTFTIVNP